MKPHYEVNAFKDPLCSFLFARWQNYFAILFLLFSLQVLVNFSSGTLLKGDVNLLPHGKTVLPALEDPIFFIYHVIGIVLYFQVKRFLLYIPKAFRTLFASGVFRGRGESTQEEVLTDYNELLKEFGYRMNGRCMYVPAFFFFLFTFLIFGFGVFFGDVSERLNLILWHDFHFYPANWIIFLTVVSLMWFMIGIYVWKMYCVVSFMRTLTKKYELTVNPFNPDGFGGFKPFRQLLLDMIFIAFPVVLYYIIVLLLSHFYGIPYLSGEKFVHLFIIIPYIVVAVPLLGYPLQDYYRIIERQKADLLENIEEEIDIYYKKIEKALLTKKKISENSMEQLKHFHDIAVRVNSIPSQPFTPSERIIIYVGAAAPWVGIIASYFG